MTEDLNKRYIFSIFSLNDNLFNLLDKTSQIICEWFSNAGNTFSFEEKFDCNMPDEMGCSSDDLFCE